MAKLITGMLTATSLLRESDAAIEVEQIDFGVRAPIGVVINKITSQLMLNDVGGLASSEFECAIQLQTREDATALIGVSFTALANRQVVNSDALLTHWMMFDGDNSAGLASASMQMAPVIQEDFSTLPVDARPVTFNPLSHIGLNFVAVEYASFLTIQYQLAEFDTNELARLAAGAL